MNHIKFTADSTIDITEELKGKLAVAIMPLTVTLGEKNFHDGVNVTPQDIYSYVARTKVLPKTAARSPEEFKSFFEENLKGADAVIHFNISSEISASNQNATIAARELKNVYVIDSRQLSTGTAVLMFYADRMRADGKTARDIVDACNNIKNCIQTSFVVDTLDYLHKGGRCSGVALLGANLLGLHPFIKMRDGKLGVGKKYKGRSMQKVFINYIDDLAEAFPEHDDNIAFVTHSGCTPEIVESVKAEVARKFRFKEVYETVAGSTITSHCGQGTLGLLFLNDKPVV